jgi:teichuronic acid exporter
LGRSEIQRSVNRGLAWIGAAQTIISILDLVTIALILRYWVTTEQSGIAHVAVSLFPMLDIAADLGVAAAVVQRDDHDQTKLSTVFWFNVLVSILLFGGLLIAGPALGEVHAAPVIGTMLIVYGGKLLFQNTYVIPMALMRKELRFGELSVIRVIANLGEAVAKVGLAAAGFALWCFVLAPLVRVLITGIGVQMCKPWWPHLRFKFSSARSYLSYGLSTSASQVLYQFYSNIDYQVVSYYFGHGALGLYSLAFRIVLEPVLVVSGVVTDAAFPAFARMRHDREHVISQFISFTRLNLITVLPILVLLFLVAPEFILVCIGPEWVPAAPAVQVLCVVGVLRSMSVIAPSVLYGIGKPNLVLRYSLVATLALPALFVAGAILWGDEYKFNAVAMAWAIGYPIAFAVLAYMTLREIKLPVGRYSRELWGVAACSGAGLVAGLMVRQVIGPLSPGMRLAAITVVVLSVQILLLWRWQGVTPRAFKKAMSK